MAIFLGVKTTQRKPGRQARKKIRTARVKISQIMAAKAAEARKKR